MDIILINIAISVVIFLTIASTLIIINGKSKDIGNRQILGVFHKQQYFDKMPL